MITYLDLGAACREFQVELEWASLVYLRSGRCAGGVDAEALEKKFAAFTQAKYCVNGGYSGLRFLIAEKMTNRLLSLPVGPQLDGASIRDVIEALKASAY
jgi:dTDP-4-amino-4,6-dideoxygalactose transaminase